MKIESIIPPKNIDVVFLLLIMDWILWCILVVLICTYLIGLHGRGWFPLCPGADMHSEHVTVENNRKQLNRVWSLKTSLVVVCAYGDCKCPQLTRTNSSTPRRRWCGTATSLVARLGSSYVVPADGSQYALWYCHGQYEVTVPASAQSQGLAVLRLVSGFLGTLLGFWL